MNEYSKRLNGEGATDLSKLQTQVRMMCQILNNVQALQTMITGNGVEA